MIDIQLADRLGSVGEYYFSKKLAEIETLRRQGHDIISLGIGSPDLPPHVSVVETLYRESMNPKNHGYASYKGVPQLLDAVAEWYGRKYGVTVDGASEVLPLYGSKEGLIYLCQTYLNAGDEVLVPNPGYPAYRSAVNLAEGKCVDYMLTEEGGWMPDFEALEAMDLSRVKIMMVNYPHMPTGTLPTEDIFRKLVDFGRRHNIIICHDNPYSFVRNIRPQSILSVEGAMDVAVELNSLSKSHNMAGWRMGMMVGAKRFIDDVLRYKSNLNSAMYIPMQWAAVKALSLGDDWTDQMNAAYFDRESLGYDILAAMGCTFSRHQAGLFAWGRLSEEGGDCYAMCDRVLYECDVFVTPGGIFGSGGERYMRVSLCASKENLEKALERIQKLEINK